ncbi:TetR/AcrR family transcriptional regulator [Brevundimonas sp.]|jgi:AcrR family transcriptional regulator|uniref:TetR/AcrR family transcriptional regulator n=1 Tax=Brevundimonas sp. TaxID=1871086 RepID=UPI0037C10B7B
MTYDAVRDLDRRSQRTRAAIFDALIRLIFSQRYDAIRTADVIEAAGVGRSTFYEHFRNKDDVLVAVIDPVFTPLAAAAAGRGARAALKAMLDHIWPQRALARVLFEPPVLTKLQRKLAGMIEARLPESVDGPPTALIAMGAAAGQLAMLRMWLVGEASCSAEVFAEHLLTTCMCVRS